MPGLPPAPVEVSRREAMKARNTPIEMPLLEWGGYLVDYLFEFGPTVPAGMGAGPVTGVELLAWQALLGVEFHPWEARLLRQLSSEYLAESHKATARDRPPPFGTAPVLKQDRAKQMQRGIDQFLA